MEKQPVQASKEAQAWIHYRDYLTEATLKKNEDFVSDLMRMHRRVYEGCPRTELRDMMVQVFDPGTVMQGLEMWQTMMDLLMFTGLRRFAGKSRDEFYKGALPYDMDDGVLDNDAPLTHIYNLSSAVQDLAHLITQAPLRLNPPKLIEALMKESGLERNAELQMLRGDLYRQVNKLDKAKRIYRDIRKKGLADDRSIDDAIIYTDLFHRPSGEPPKP
ncbi:MAG: hypothetical protein IJ088_15040 [Clostridia bacterium]|nr:hypothetical protein [Clostridia bacterium]